MLSKTATYGIKAILFVAYESKHGRRVGGPEVAKNIDAPVPFTAKIMQQLARSGIVNSIKGPNGGFEMTEKQRQKSNIRSIVEALDGDSLYTQCGLGLDKCNDYRPCPIHETYTEVRKAIIEMHTKESIEELAGRLDDLAVLK